MSNHQQKGDALEDAVRAIEEAILRSSPALNEGTFLIESKKVVVISGVKHEIDIWVEIHAAKGYQAVFIFECKNWEKKVSKNEIIVFSEKIRALQAQRGFFVAKSFTSHAISQADLNPRLELLQATEHNPAKLPMPFGFHQLINEFTHTEVNVGMRDSSLENDQKPLDSSKVCAVLDGEEVDFREFIKQLSHKAVDRFSKNIPSGKMAAGSYEYEAYLKEEYEPGRLTLDGVEVAKLDILVQFTARIVRAPILSRFDIESRGRVYEFAPVTFPRIGALRLNLIELTDNNGSV